MRHVLSFYGLIACLPLITLSSGSHASAQLGGPATPPAATTPTPQAEALKYPELPPTAVALNPQQTVYLDKAQKKLYLKTLVCLREGMLELFLCKKNSKEHESILSLDSSAFAFHGGLLALGANTGQPVKYEPTYVAPQGEIIELQVSYLDPKTGQTRQADAKSWMRTATRRYFGTTLTALPSGFKLPEGSELVFDDRNAQLLWFGPMSDEQLKSNLELSSEKSFQDAVKDLHQQSQAKAFSADFVFAGSGFYVDPETKERFYLAEGGELICVANFSAATIDIAENSSATNTSLLYEAHPEHVPAEGTPVLLQVSVTGKQRTGNAKAK